MGNNDVFYKRWGEESKTCCLVLNAGRRVDLTLFITSHLPGAEARIRKLSFFDKTIQHFVYGVKEESHMG